MNKIEEAITGYWGEKCKDFDKDCPCCQAWFEYEKLIDELLGYRHDNEKLPGYR